LGEVWSTLTDVAVSLFWSWGGKGKPITKKAMAVEMKPLKYLKMIGK